MAPSVGMVRFLLRLAILESDLEECSRRRRRMGVKIW